MEQYSDACLKKALDAGEREHVLKELLNRMHKFLNFVDSCLILYEKGKNKNSCHNVWINNRYIDVVAFQHESNTYFIKHKEAFIWQAIKSLF